MDTAHYVLSAQVHNPDTICRQRSSTGCELSDHRHALISTMQARAEYVLYRALVHLVMYLLSIEMARTCDVIL